MNFSKLDTIHVMLLTCACGSGADVAVTYDSHGAMVKGKVTCITSRDVTIDGHFSGTGDDTFVRKIIDLQDINFVTVFAS